MNYSSINIHVYSNSEIVILVFKRTHFFFRYILPNTAGYRKCAEDF